MNKTGGVLLFLAGSVIWMGIVTGEIFYPGFYTTSQSEISDLGATRPPESIIYPLPSMIFNTTMIVSGLLIMAAVYLLRQTGMRLLSFIPILIMGSAISLVGFFPGDKAPWHGLAAMTTFISGGISAILSSKSSTTPMNVISVILGVITLSFLLAAIFAGEIIISVMGDGGVERWVAYPVVIWMIVFGGYLIGKNTKSA